MPGEYSTGSRPAPHKVEVATGEPGNPHVYTDQNQPGRSDHHTVNYDIWDHRDRPHLRSDHPHRRDRVIHITAA